MVMLADHSVEEQIEILQLIEQQLTIRIELRSRLTPTKSHDVLFASTPLRKAIKESAPLTMLQLPEGMEQQAAAVRLKLEELEGKQDHVTEINQRCEGLIKAVVNARDWVNQGSGCDRESENSSTSADLNILIDEASAIVNLCKNFKTLYGIAAPLRTESFRGWDAPNAQHRMEPPRSATPTAAKWNGTWSDHAEDDIVDAEDGSVYAESENMDGGYQAENWGPGPAEW